MSLIIITHQYYNLFRAGTWQQGFFHYAMESTDSAVYVFGGMTRRIDPRALVSVSQVAKFENGAWSKIGDLTQNRYRNNALLIDGKIYLAGGWCEPGDCAVEVWDPETDSRLRSTATSALRTRTDASLFHVGPDFCRGGQI